jgi:hypothetical protein
MDTYLVRAYPLLVPDWRPQRKWPRSSDGFNLGFGIDVGFRFIASRRSRWRGRDSNCFPDSRNRELCGAQRGALACPMIRCKLPSLSPVSTAFTNGRNRNRGYVRRVSIAGDLRHTAIFYDRSAFPAEACLLGAVWPGRTRCAGHVSSYYEPNRAHHT